jgi:ABC-type spermidine/putrescine transport system permease subunit II
LVITLIGIPIPGGADVGIGSDFITVIIGSTVLIIPSVVVFILSKVDKLVWTKAKASDSLFFWSIIFCNS